jgi:IS5 family transposase
LLSKDVASGVVLTLTGTAANKVDINRMAALLHGREEAVFADAIYAGASQAAGTCGPRCLLEHRDQALDLRRFSGEALGHSAAIF